MNSIRYLSLLVLFLPLYTLAASDHQFEWGTRSRYANVDAENSGQAASILLRGTLESHWSDIVGSTLEVDHVSTAFDDDHSNGERLNGQPLIPDASGTEINQAFMSINLEQAFIHLGRQRINFDNQRFIGGNGFWQNEQTFDAALGKLKISTNSNLTYAYIANANRIFGDDADENITGMAPDGNYAIWDRPVAHWGDHEHNTHLARLEWNEWDYTRLAGYAYRIDNQDMPVASNNTLGVSYNFNYKYQRIKYRVHLEVAQQDRYEINADGLDYYLLDLGFGFGAVEINTRYEILGENKGAAFITPLGSNHDFEGWADEVGNTPNSGVRNASLGLLWRASPFRVETSYHLFKNDLNGGNIGEEFDLDFSYKPASKHTISLRLANFEPEGDSGAIRKVYLDYSYNM